MSQQSYDEKELRRLGKLSAPQMVFSVWAPFAEDLKLKIDDEVHPMARDEEGWWHPAESLPREYYRTGHDYGYLINGSDTPRPGPRSRWQPHGVHGMSRTFDRTDHQWADQNWTGRQLAGGVIYELHVGTFTPGPDGRGGTLDSAIEKLDHLVDLGVTFIELMPVNEFNGNHGWGYDGVLWYAVHHAYGGAAAYMRFVDACHARGLGVIQDVVYNHLGPSGNFLPEFGPYLNGRTSWGSGINLDGEGSDEVRRYIVDNALMWLRDFHVDGLRLDAVHAFDDRRAVHLLEEMSEEVDSMSAFLGRPLTLIAESDLNDPRVITPRTAGGYGIHAQWSDDFHHAVVANLTGRDTGYYADFASLQALAKVVHTGFFHDGSVSTFRGRRHGRPVDQRLSAWRLVVCSDNHDQIGNRADGRRLSANLGIDRLVIAAALTILGPNTPMIFQGEEWGASTPWMFFTSHPEPELADAVRKGRLEEFAKMEWGDVEVPDPQAMTTFTGSFLNWSEVDEDGHAELLAVYRELLAIRRREPDLTRPRLDWSSAECDPDGRWFVVRRGPGLALVVNLSGEPTRMALAGVRARLFAHGTVERDEETDSVELGAWSVALFALDPV